MKKFSTIATCCSIALLSACGSAIDPHNEPMGAVPNQMIDIGQVAFDDTVIGLSFSGGGTRAAAFAHGVLKEMATVTYPINGVQRPLVDRIDFLSGVSGGSVAAAYFAHKGPAALEDFREKFLLADVQASLRTAISPGNLVRAVGAGGVNDQSGFPRWLDQNLFQGATFGELLRKRKPILWINASDVYTRNPFVFDQETFAALCSNFENYPLAEAVAASAAVPIAFAPVVIQNHARSRPCGYKLPAWTAGAIENVNAPASLKSYAQGLQRYTSDETLNFVKLLDGGLADNFGLQGITLARARAQDPHAPLTPQQAVGLKRLLFLVVDAGRPVTTTFQKTLDGHNGIDLVMAATDTAMNSTVRISYDSFTASMRQWREDLIRYRCALPQARVLQYRKTLAGWKCRDVNFFIGKVSFDQVNDAALLGELAKVETSLTLPADQVDRLILAAKLAMDQNPSWRAFRESLSGKAPDIAGKARLSVSRGPADEDAHTLRPSRQ